MPHASQENPAPVQGRSSRRGVLRGFWFLLWAGLVAAAGLALGAALRLISAGSGAASAGTVAFDPQKLPLPGQVLAQGKVALLRDQAGLFALSLTCPHLGCRPEWSPVQGRFLCPCHGSAFAYDGALLKGPAQQGLGQLALERDARGWLLADPQRPAPAGARLKAGEA